MHSMAGSSAKSQNSRRAKCQTNRRLRTMPTIPYSFCKPTHWDSLSSGWEPATDRLILRRSKRLRFLPDKPTDVRVSGFPVPFRVACLQMGDGSHIYLGLSERDELRVLGKMRLRFSLLWLLVVFWVSASCSLPRDAC